MESFKDKYKGLLIFMLAYWGVCFVMLLQQVDFLYVMLGWNTLLAVLPLWFMMKVGKSVGQKREKWTALWILLWLFFFPNSVYMVTDFIHISNDEFYQKTVIEIERYETLTEVVYSQEIINWAKLFVIGAGFFFAMFAGLESLYLLEQISRRKFSAAVCSIGVAVVALLTGIGVYIGRFLRFNSWDILADPMGVLQGVLRADLFAWQFILIFTVFVLGSYGLYKTMRSQGRGV